MPPRDHFRPPVSKRSSWEGFLGMGPMVMVQQLAPRLPEGFVAEPRVHLGTFYEIDLCSFETGGEDEPPGEVSREPERGGVTTATRVAPTPTWTAETEFPDEYAYEVLIFDLDRDRRLVAAVEIVSPAEQGPAGQPPAG